MKKLLLSLSVIGIMFALFTGCEDENPVTPPVYTSNLIGKWTQVVDTVTAEGRAFWIQNDIFGYSIRKPEIEHYVNDTVCFSGYYNSINYVDSIHYFTKSDTVYYHSRGGMITKADTVKHKFRIKNDTLYYDNSDNSVGCFIRIK